jgi:hypothetical protein
MPRKLTALEFAEQLKVPNVTTRVLGGATHASVGWAIGWAKTRIRQLSQQIRRSTIQREQDKQRTRFADILTFKDGSPVNSSPNESIPKSVVFDRRYYYAVNGKNVNSIELFLNAYVGLWSITIRAIDAVGTPVLFLITDASEHEAIVGSGESTTEFPVTRVNLSTIEDDESPLINVVPVRATALGNRFTFSTTEETELSGKQAWRNFDARRLYKVLSPWVNINVAAIKSTFIWVSPPELVAITGMKYQATSMVPVYYDRANDKITLWVGENGIGEPDQQFRSRLLDPSGNPGGSSYDVPVINIEIAASFFWTIDVDDYLVSGVPAGGRTTLTDVSAGSPLSVDWALEVGLLTDPIPTEDGAFDFVSTDQRFVDGGLTTINFSIRATGVISGGIASSVLVEVSPSFLIEGDSILAGFTNDLTGNPPILSDMGQHFNVTRNNVALGSNALSEQAGKYVDASSAATEKLKVTVTDSNKGGWSGASGYPFGTHFAGLIASRLAPPGFVDFPASFDFIESDTHAGSPLIRHVYNTNLYLYEGVHVIHRRFVQHEGFLRNGKAFVALEGTSYTENETTAEWKVFTWINGIIQPSTRSFDASITQDIKDPSPGSVPYQLKVEQSGGTISMTDLFSRDTPVDVGTGGIITKSVTQPPQSFSSAQQGMHTILSTDKKFDDGFGNDIFGENVEIDPISGFKRVTRPSGTLQQARILDETGAIIAEYVDDKNARNEQFNIRGIQTSFIQVFSDVGFGVLSFSEPGIESTDVVLVDGKFDFRFIGQGLNSMANDSRIYMNDIGLTPDNGISIRWIDAVEDQHGLFMGLVSTDFETLRDEWATINADVESTPEQITAARDAAVAEITVLYNNFASLDFVLAAASTGLGIDEGGLHLYIVDKQVDI